jgi:MFS family permease
VTGPVGALVDRRRTWVVGAVALTTAVVALAATAGVDDGRARDPGAVTDVVATVLEAAVLLYVVVMIGVIAVVIFPTRGGQPGERQRRLAWPMVVMCVLAAIALWIAGPLGGGDETVDTPPRPPGIAPGPAPPAREAVDDPPGWALGAVGLAVVAATVGALVLVTRRRSTDAVAAPVTLPPTPEEQDDAVARARACTDPRESVLLAFAAAETVLGRDAVTRRPPATSAREWAALVRSRPLDRLVSRYEVARFSQHDITDADRAEAIDALEALR